MTPGERLKQIREKLHLTQAEMAEALTTAPKTYWNYENNKRDISSDVLHNLSFKFNVNLNWLVAKKGAMFESPNSFILRADAPKKQNPDFSSRLQEIMAANKMTISNFETITKIPYKRLIKMIAENSAPNLNELLVISALFDVTMDWLIYND